MALEDIGPAAQRFIDPRSPFDLNHNLGVLLIEGGDKPLPAPDEIKAQVLDRIHLMPRLRRRLVIPPMRIGPAFLCDDPDFDIDDHFIVVEGELIRPARFRQIVGIFQQRPLSRQHPLWEVMLVYGLDDGGMAIITKAHHLIIDGLLGWQSVFAMLVDLSADGTPMERQDWSPDPLPSTSDVVRHAVGTRVRLAGERAAGVVGTVRDAESRHRELGTLRALPQTIRDEVLARAPQLPINGPNGIRREVDWTSLSLPAIKAAAKRFPEHVTVNDVVLTLVSEGLRAQLLSMGMSDPLPSVRINVPVSVARRAEGQQFDQRDSYIVVDLPLAEADIARRLQAIVACAEPRKGTEASVIEEMLDVVFMLPSRERALAWQVLASAKVFNLALSNVQGLQQTLYFRGHPIARVLAIAALPEDHGLRLMALSAEDIMSISVTRSPEVVADADPLLRGIERGMEALGAGTPVAAA